MACKNTECQSGKPVFAQGLCSGCYYRLRRRGVVGRKYKSGGSTGQCSVGGCTNKAHAAGKCSRHYQQGVNPMRNVWKVLRSRAQGAYPTAWEDFDQFMADVGDRPGEKYQLRRVRADEPWSIQNFEWREPVKIKGDFAKFADKAAYQRAWSYLRKFGLREEDITRMRADQDDNCGVCQKPLEAMHVDTGKPIRICVDHDHKTGSVRGLLHDHCNKLLGHADDDIDLLKGAVAYLERHTPA